MQRRHGGEMVANNECDLTNPDNIKMLFAWVPETSHEMTE